MTITKYLFFFFISFLVTINSSAQNKVIHINYQKGQEEITDPLILKMKKALKDIPYNLVFHPLPSLRTLQSLKNEETEIELARIAEIEESISDKYIRVNTPIAQYTSGYYFFNKKFLIKKNINKATVRLGIMRGSIMALQHSKDFKKVLIAETPEQLLSLLANNRIDIFIEKYHINNNLSLQHKNLYFQPLSKRPVYTYVRNDYKHLIPTLEKYYRLHPEQ